MRRAGRVSRQGTEEEEPYNPCGRVYRFYPEGKGNPLTGFRQWSEIGFVFQEDHKRFWKHKEKGLGTRQKEKRPLKRLQVKKG